MRRLTLLLLFAAPAAAKPITLRIDLIFEQAWLTAEAQIVEVEVADWNGQGPKRGRVRVKVTSDPRHIYRGYEFLGKTLDLLPAFSGPQTCSAELARMAGSQDKRLIVVDKTRSLLLLGTPMEAGYEIRGWCDFNRCFLRSETADFGSRALIGSRMIVKRAQIEKRCRTSRRAFWARVARFLTAEPPTTKRAVIEAWIRDLASADPGRRRRGQSKLARHAQLHVALLRDRAGAARDPELRRRLQLALTRIRPYVDAYDVALRLAKQPRDERLWAVGEGLTQLDGKTREHVQRWYAVQLQHRADGVR